MIASILVIDDEESMRFTLERFLAAEGHRVRTAGSYQEAMEIISHTEPDLIYSDIILGGKTGIDVLREVRDRDLNCPLVVITGYPDVQTATEAVRLGAFDYIPKPVLKETILRTTHLALKHKALVEEKERYRANLEAIFGSVKDGIISVDKELRLIEVNEAGQKICGLSRSSVGGDFGAMERICTGKCIEALKEAIEKREIVERYRVECGHEGEGAVPRIVDLSIFPLVAPRGAFSGAVMVVRDETRLAHLEQDLKERRRFRDLVGGSEVMQRTYGLIEILANVTSTVLITGESGTGKELVAEAIHYGGVRCTRPLIKVNCSALPDNLLESELFGHVRGAFTGAIRDTVGRFQKADGGTLFLDEIGDISPRMQLSLLRVLQENEIERVGDSTQIKVDVRVIAATNRSLPEKIARGEFREDLYYRLKVVELSLPALRERPEDIPLLIDHFIGKFNKKLDKSISGVSDEVLSTFMGYPWPGNVRELQHALEHAFILCAHKTITHDHLPPELQKHRTSADTVRSSALKHQEASDQSSIIGALKKTAGNKAKAARLLGISQRTIHRKIKLFNIPSSDYSTDA